MKEHATAGYSVNNEPFSTESVSLRFGMSSFYSMEIGHCRQQSTPLALATSHLLCLSHTKSPERKRRFKHFFTCDHGAVL